MSKLEFLPYVADFHGVALHFSNYWESLAAKGRRRFYETMDWQKAWSIRDVRVRAIFNGRAEKTATRTAPEVARFDAGACNFD